MRKILFLFLVVLFGCVHFHDPERPLSFQEIADSPNSFHQKEVFVSGYILADVLGGISLYKSSSDAIVDHAFDAIDLIPVNPSLTKQLKFKEVTCVIAHGKFQAYGHGEITFDLPSKYGALHIDSYSTCKK